MICSIFLKIPEVFSDESDKECGIVAMHQQNLAATKDDLIAAFDKMKSKKKTSLSLIFDNTGSMSKDLKNLRSAAIKIIDKFNSYGADNPIGNYILSIFNDPGVEVHETKNSQELLSLLNGIKIDGGRDCPEMALTGIKRALELADFKSYAFVFTDADAKDFSLKRSVLEIIQKKQAIVSFLKTGSCGPPYPDEGHQVYHEVAKASGGQVFEIKRDDVDEVLVTISSRLEKDHIQMKSEYYEAGEKSKTEVKLDASLSKVMITLAGENPEINVRNGNNELVVASTKSEKNNIIFLTFDVIDDPIWVISATAKSSYSVIVDGKSQMKILFGFSVEPPIRISETFPQPLKNSKNHLSIFLSEPTLVKCLTNIILVTNDKKEHKFSLVRRGDFYITDLVNFPSDMFKIMINGYDKNGRKIERLISTAIEPTDASEY